MALAIATRCCSPPDNCDGKLLSLSFRPTFLSTLLGLDAFLLQTWTANSTFSKAVRLGTKL